MLISLFLRHPRCLSLTFPNKHSPLIQFSLIKVLSKRELRHSKFHHNPSIKIKSVEYSEEHNNNREELRKIASKERHKVHNPHYFLELSASYLDEQQVVVYKRLDKS